MYGRCVHEWTDVQIGIKEWMDEWMWMDWLIEME